MATNADPPIITTPQAIMDILAPFLAEIKKHTEAQVEALRHEMQTKLESMQEVQESLLQQLHCMTAAQQDTAGAVAGVQELMATRINRKAQQATPQVPTTPEQAQKVS